MNQKVRGNEYRSTIVCIDGYDNNMLSGRFYNAFRKEGESFDNLMQFLLKMEQMLDAMVFPQSFAAVRTFFHPPAPVVTSPPELKTAWGKLATFEVRVLFRQNASWQGSVAWLEENREESFRSALELFVLMDSALTSQKQEMTPA